MNAYVREYGPICYEAHVFLAASHGIKVFLDLAVRVQLLEELLSSGLAWCWKSGRSDPNASSPQSPGRPAYRPMTQLTPNNLPSFTADLEESDIDGCRRWVILVGVDPDAVETLLNPGTFRAALDEFTVRESGPIRVVVTQVGDINHEYVFVPHEPVTSVSLLLQAWGTGPGMTGTIRHYKELRLSQLEYYVAAVGWQ